MTAQEVMDKIRGPGGARWFFEVYLGETLDEQQVAMVEALEDPNVRRISVSSGNSCGKDWFAGRAALWFHLRYYPSTVITTGPTERQVEKIVWGELREAYSRAESLNPGLPIGGLLLPNSSELRSWNPEYPKNSDLPYHPKHFIQGYVGKSKETYKGFHNRNVLVIVTEAQGVDPEAYVAIDQLATAEEVFKLILLGNPTCEAGHPFHASHEKDRAIFCPIVLDSRKSSHCGPEFFNDIESKYGRGSPMWLMCVEGLFVEDLADTLLPLSWIRAAQRRWATEPAGDMKTLGLDVARFGADFTTAYLGEGNRFRQVMKRQGQDLMETTGRAGLLATEHGVPDRHVRIDDTGVGGGVTDRLRELAVERHGEGPAAINFGSDASDPKKFYDARSEMAWEMRERFRLGTIAIDPADGLLEADLLVLKWKPTSDQRFRLERKDELKKRIGRSPDYADALMLATVGQAVAETVAAKGKPNAGLLDFINLEMKRLEEKKRKESLILSERPASEIPGAATLLNQGVRDGEREASRVPGWTSVLPS